MRIFSELINMGRAKKSSVRSLLPGYDKAINKQIIKRSERKTTGKRLGSEI